MGRLFCIKFLIKVVRGGHLALLLSDRGNGRIKPFFQGGFIKVSGKGPIQSRLLRSLKEILNRASANA
jgi:hypothetical protein